MARLQDLKATRPIKTLLIGDSGTGKTGALAALATAGYNVRILDFDDGISSLTEYLLSPKSPYLAKNPQAAERVRVKTLSDKYKAIGGLLVPYEAKAWKEMTEALSGWKEPDGEDFGSLDKWGPQDVLVVDSLTRCAGVAALNWHLFCNNALTKTRTQNEARRDIGAAQAMIEDLLQAITSGSIKCNVVVISHITMVSESGGAPVNEKGEAQIAAGYPSAIGRALSPRIPTYFDSMLVATIKGTGTMAKRVISSQPLIVAGQTVAAKNMAPLTVQKEYPLETGLADYFADVKGQQNT